jgi:hypothetical protein
LKKLETNNIQELEGKKNKYIAANVLKAILRLESSNSFFEKEVPTHLQTQMCRHIEQLTISQKIC